MLSYSYEDDYRREWAARPDHTRDDCRRTERINVDRCRYTGTVWSWEVIDVYCPRHAAEEAKLSG